MEWFHLDDRNITWAQGFAKWWVEKTQALEAVEDGAEEDGALGAVEGVAEEDPGDFPCAADGGVFALVEPPGGGVATFCWDCRFWIMFMAFSNCTWRFLTTGSCKPRLAEIQRILV